MSPPRPPLIIRQILLLAADSSPAPPTPQDQAGATQSPDSLASPTPTPTPLPDLNEQLSIAIIDNTAAASIEEFDLTVTESGSAQLATDKTDYAPTDTALITGAGFQGNTTYSLTISSSDDPATSTTVEVTTDADGILFYAYQLDGVYRPNYKVEAFLGSILVATVTFTDAATGTLYPNGQGTYTSWTGDEGDVDETGTPDCDDGSDGDDNVAESTTGDRESVLINLSSVPDGSTITNIDVNVTYRNGNGGSDDNGTFQTFTRLNSTDLDSGTNLIATNTTCTSGTQTINVADTLKNGATTLEVGVLKTVADTSEVYVGTIRAVVTYTEAPTAPAVVWPTTWTTPNSCVTDPIGESGVAPTEVDLTGSSGTPAVGFATDANYHYFRERINGNPGTASSLNNYSWVVLFQSSNPQYQYLGSLSGKEGNKVLLYDNLVHSPDSGGVDFLPLFNDPADNIVWEGPSSTYGRVTGSGPYYVDWAIPLTELTSRGITTSTTKFFATSTNANNFNKDSLQCYEQFADLSIVKSDSPDPVTNGGVLTYTLSINNAGPDTASSVVVIDSLPTGYTVTTVTPSVGSCSDITEPGIQCELGDMASGANATITIVGTITTASSTITNTASVSLDTTRSLDRNLANNTDSEDTTINPNTGTVVVHKDVQGPNGEDVTDASNSFEVSLDGGAGQLVSDNIPHTYSNVPAGNHTITESLVDTDYTLYGISTAAGQVGTPAGLVVSVASGQTVDVYVTNRQKSGTITVIKDVVSPTGAPVSDTHSFTANLSPGSQTSPLAEGSNAVFTVSPGTYTVTETDDPAYLELGCLTATGKTDIVVASGEGKTITCTNQQIQTSLTVIKNVINNNGSTRTPADFTIEVTGTNVSDPSFPGSAIGTTVTLDPGSYSVGEAYQLGHQMSLSADCSGTIALGEHKTCTVTNDDKPATLIVRKIVVGGDSTPDDFTFSYNQVGPVTFEADGQNDLSLNPGTYTVTEFPDSAYATTYSTDCTNGVVENGETITCTITNTRKTGRLFIDKILFNNEGPGQPSDWTFMIDGVFGTWTTGQFVTLNTGLYSITESTGIEGYSVMSVGDACSNLNGSSATATVGVGDQTCTFTNARDKGSVLVHKRIDLNGDGDWNDTNENSDTYANANGFSWVLDGAPRPYGTTVTDLATTLSFYYHNFEEYMPAGYHFVSWYNTLEAGRSCANPNSTLMTDRVTVLKNQTTNITLCNQKEVGSIKIIKAVPGTNDQDFTFTGSGVLGSFTLDDNGSDSTSGSGKSSFKQFTGIAAGSYTVTETSIPASWVLDNLTCTGDTDYQVNGATVTIDLDHGENVICTFANRQPTGTITIVKEAIPTSDDNFSFDVNSGFPGGDFELEDDGNDNNGGTEESKTVTVVTGQYTVEEDGESGWKLTNLICDDQNSTVNLGNKRATINVEANETIICTFTNQKLATLIIKKDATPNSDDNFRFTRSFGGSFELEDDGNNNNGGTDETATFSDLNPGSYTVTEDSKSGWALTDIVCSDQTVPNISGRSVTLDLAYNETVTCTFKNLELGKIEGEKFNDKDADNHDDGSSESALSGWRIFLDDGDGLFNGERNYLTNASGEYTFDNLMPGTYQVCEEPQLGWYPTTGTNCKTTTIHSDGGDTDEINFANHQNLTIQASKIVCDLESDLPNWGDNDAPSITSSTAQNYVNSHPRCHLQSGWDFQYGLDTQVNKYGNGDQLGAASAPWQTLGTTDGTGVAITTINDLQGKSGIWVREVLQPNYVPFSYPPAAPTADNYSAEIYCHQDGDHYDNFDQIDNPLFGNTYYCVAWNALNTGDLEVTKYNDLNGNGSLDPGEPGLSDWQINVSGEESQNTDVNGSTTFTDLVIGSYELSETLQDGWTQTEISCGAIDHPEGQIADDEYYAQIHPGQTTHCRIGNVQLTDIHGYKWNDENGNSHRDCFIFDALSRIDFNPECEPLLGGWTINLYKFDGETWNWQDDYVTEAEGEHLGWYWFTDLLPGQYKTCEELQDDWTQTYPSEDGCHYFELPNDQVQTENSIIGQEYDFGNQADPNLTIEKSNDATGAQSPGSDVLYTLRIELQDSNLNGVTVTDVPPTGFTYRLGSWTANSSIRGDLKAALVTTEPTYASPGLWQLGDMVAGEVVTLTYLADVSGSQDGGTYKDLAWAEGKNSYSDATIRATGQNSTYIDGIFVGTEVEIVKSEQQTGTVNIEKTGEVLGASTELPATGANSVWLFLALGSLLSGLALIFGGKFMKKLLMIAIFLILGHRSLVIAPVKAATNGDSNLSIRMESPKTPTRLQDWTLAFTTLDIEKRAMTVKCFVKKPVGSFSQFDTDKTFPATLDKSSGGSGSCQVNSSVMGEQGTYEFYVTATAGAGEDVTDISSVLYDTDGPGKPTSYSKDHPSSCRWVIKFHTADDGGLTQKVEIYSSDSTNFDTHSGTRVGTVNIGSNQDGEFIHDRGSDCDKTWYYVIRAFDSLGNQSAHLGDEIVHITTLAPSPTSTTGAIVVTSATGSVLGKETNVDGSESGEVKGIETSPPSPSVEGQGLLAGAKDAVKVATSGNRKWWFLAVVVAILIGYAFTRKAKKTQ